LKLRVKTTAVVGVSTAATSLIVGAGVLGINFDAGVKNLESRLNTLAAQVEKTSDDQLSVALASVRSQEVTLAYLEDDGTVTVLQDSAGALDSARMQKKWVNLGYGERLIFGVSQRPLFETLDASIWLTLVLSLVASLLTGATTWLLLARDINTVIRLTADAKRIAEGSSASVAVTKGSDELSELSLALDSMVGQLKGAKDQMQVFLSDASHELRTPLTVMRGYLEILQKQPEIRSAQSKRAIERAGEAALKMQNLVNDLLTLARLGEVSPAQPESLLLAQVYQPLVEDLIALQPSRKVQVIDKQKSPLYASRELLGFFFTNALSNIRLHTPAAAKARITITQVASSNLKVVIEDAGPGIPQVATGNEAATFKRFDANRSGGEQSSGLGMSIMTKAIEAQGGKLLLGQSEFGGLKITATIIDQSQNVGGTP
jgi:K+-sensing histidine kinase KdpD